MQRNIEGKGGIKKDSVWISDDSRIWTKHGEIPIINRK